MSEEEAIEYTQWLYEEWFGTKSNFKPLSEEDAIDTYSEFVCRHIYEG